MCSSRILPCYMFMQAFHNKVYRNSIFRYDSTSIKPIWSAQRHAPIGNAHDSRYDVPTHVLSTDVSPSGPTVLLRLFLPPRVDVKTEIVGILIEN